MRDIDIFDRHARVRWRKRIWWCPSRMSDGSRGPRRICRSAVAHSEGSSITAPSGGQMKLRLTPIPIAASQLEAMPPSDVGRCDNGSMDWRRYPTDDPNDPDGLDALLRRVQRDVGGPPLTGTVFLHDAREMLRSTREIEAVARDAKGTLYVGFQSASKLDREHAVYGDLVERGTRVFAFGVGSPQNPPAGLHWTALAEDRTALENQWYCVMQDPEPIAFVGFETSPGELYSRGDAGDEGKRWKGFVSDDTRLVRALATHLREVSGA